MPRAAQHRDELVRTAMRLFRRQGYASTGLQQILQESGAPRGSLYHYFPGGKEEIAVAAIELAGALIREMLEEAARAHPRDVRRFVQRYARTMARWMKESDFSAGCPVATTLLETVPGSRVLAETGNRVFDAWIEVIAGVFEASDGQDDRSRDRAQQLLATMEGALLLARVRGSTRPILDIPGGY